MKSKNTGADYLPPSTHHIHVARMREKASLANKDNIMLCLRDLIAEHNVHRDIEEVSEQIKNLEKENE